MRKNWLPVFLIIISGIIVYANSFQNPFIWDDQNLIVTNPYIKDIRLAKNLFTKDLAFGTQFSNFYRPLQSLSFELDYYLWKLNPFGFHLTNLLLHIGCALLVYFLFALILPERKTIPLVTSLLFLVHPVQTEAVTYISGRADPQVGLFSLLSIILYIKYTRMPGVRKRIYLAGAILSYIFALLSKETALMLPLIILLYDVTFSGDEVRFRDKLKFRYSSFFLATFIYILLRMTVLNFLQRPLFLSNIPVYPRLLTITKIFVLYVTILILPLHLHMERSLPFASSILDKDILCSVILLLFLGILIARSYKYSKVFFFGSVWFFLNLLPVSNIVPLNANMAEHWLYLPSIGFFLGVALGFDTLFRKTGPIKILSTVLLTILLIFYSYLTLQRNRDWKDPKTFFQNILTYNPQSVEAHNCLGAIYQGEGKIDLAIDEFRQAVGAAPHNYKSYGNLGSALRRKGEYDLAISAYKKALSLRPDVPGLYNNLGNVYTDKGQWDKAKEMLLKALEMFPEFALCRVNLGKVYYETDNIELAVEEYKKAIALEPNLVIAHLNLAIAYHKQKKYNLAVGEYKKVIEIEPDNVAAHLNLGTAYNVAGRLDDAIKQYQKVLKLNPYNFFAYHNLGVVYVKKKEFSRAKNNFSHALRINPEYAPSKNFLKILEK